ncbi:basal cell adhesion molecule-like isoform X2 [Cetorhinus maximus]
MSSAATPRPASVSGGLCLTLFILTLALTGINGTVQVSTPPMVEAEIGKPISIPCIPEISTPSTMKYIQWFVMEKNSRKRIYFQDGERRIIDNETDYTSRIKVVENYTLTIDHVELGDERTFLCQVGAGAAGSGEATTELKVYDAPEVPEITPSEAIISVMETTPAKVATCHTRNGYPAPNITWYKDRTPLQATTKINSKMYMISQATQEPSGLYSIVSALYYVPEKKDKDSKFYCEVSYRMPPGVDKMKESVRISIPISYPTENVEFVFQPRVVKEKDNMTMKCKSDGSSDVEYTFYRVLDGQDEEILDSIGNTLEFNGVQRMDSGVYGCRVLDFDVLHKDFNTNKTITINYLDPIALKPNGPYIFMEGDKNKSIYCSAKGSQQTSVIWKKHKKTVSPENMLQLPVATFEDSGNYTCEVTVQNVPSLTQQKSISIIVKGKSHSKSSGGMLIVIIIVCIILLAFLGAVLYFLYKKGKIPCGRSGKQDITRTDAHDDIVVEVKNDQKVPEETVLLQGVNGEKKPPSDQ